MMQNKEQHGANEPVKSQPWSGGAVSPMTPAPIPCSVQGLEYLSQASQMLVQLKLKCMQVCRQIVYEIKNSMGQKVYTITEDYNCACQYFCLGNRSITGRICDNTGNLVMEVYKPFQLFTLCCNPKTEVRMASGVPMAYIVRGLFPCTVTFKILNENGDEVLQISPLHSNFFEKKFKITSIREKIEVGRISLYGTPCFLFPDTINFDVHFSLDLDVKLKAAILGTLLLFSF
ncbi:phospholipid scramblase 1-like [Bufo gargarizans]|uniref:phospholipid scramblase 1-like n=1 Tax=Bufo gargarizans TaxID=30331 RepID=UPI001CF2C8AD|nr:phospholipid scramblase 1-like [Bufo gargarizans]